MTGNILSVRSIFLAMSPYQIMIENPWSTLSHASACSYLITPSFSFKECGTLNITASICFLNYAAPQSAGHPLLAYSNNISANGCCNASAQGYIIKSNLHMRLSLSTSIDDHVRVNALGVFSCCDGGCNPFIFLRSC